MNQVVGNHSYAMATSPILIFDGTNTFHRNFVVNPTADPNGNPIGGLMGTIKSIKWMIRDLGPKRVFFVWDGKGGSQRRRGIVSEYKMGRRPRANREVDESPEDSRGNFEWQKQKLSSFLHFLGVTQIEIDNIEADDTIGFLCGALEGQHKVVCSSDRDMWQLVSPTCTVYWPTKKIYITTENFNELTPIRPENYVLAKAIAMGDNSDNIKAIKGLGEKTLLKLFPELSTRPDCTPEYIFGECRAILEQQGPNPKGKFRWYKVILDSSELITKNIEVMQLTNPEISAQAASIIRNAVNNTPQVNMTGLKIALLNNGIQITDVDFLSTFQEFKVRIENALV